MSYSSDDYYAPWARVDLERPVLLIGRPGAQVEHTARALTGYTGLPLALIGDSVAHEAGASVAHVARQQGIDAVDRLVDNALRRHIDQRPCAVIAATDRALHGWWSRRSARRGARVIAISRPAEVLVRGLLHQRRANPLALAELGADSTGDEAELAALLERRPSLDALADEVIDAGDRHPERVARELEALLG